MFDTLLFNVACISAVGLAVVFSPLISLMQDQVEHLLAHGIKANYISGSQNEADISDIYQARKCVYVI
jgi:superfamily II DNA helicase RecQ